MHEYHRFLVCLNHLLLSDTAFAILSKKTKQKKIWPQPLILLSVSGAQLTEREP